MGYEVNLQVPGCEGDILRDPSADAVYTAWTGAGGCHQFVSLFVTSARYLDTSAGTLQ